MKNNKNDFKAISRFKTPVFMGTTVLFSALFFVFFSGCNGTEQTPEDVLELDRASFAFDTKAANATFRIISNAEWTLSCDDTWLTYTPEADNGCQNVSVSIPANRGVDRIGVITITTKNGISRTVKITQEGLLVSRKTSSMAYTMTEEIQITWASVADASMLYTTVKYTDASNQPKEVRIENDAKTVVMPGLRLGTPFYVTSTFNMEGTNAVSGETKIDPQSLDYARTDWKTIYTSTTPQSDGFPSGFDAAEKARIGAQNAHIDGYDNTFLSLSKPGKNTNTGANETPMWFVLDLQTAVDIDYWRMQDRMTGGAAGLTVRKITLFGTNDYKGGTGFVDTPTADPTEWKLIDGSVLN